MAGPTSSVVRGLTASCSKTPGKGKFKDVGSETDLDGYMKNASKVDGVEVLWPSGKKEKIGRAAVNAVNRLVEGRGIVP